MSASPVAPSPLEEQFKLLERRHRAHLAREIERNARLDLLESRLRQLVDVLDLYLTENGNALKKAEEARGLDDIAEVANRITVAATFARKSLPK